MADPESSDPRVLGAMIRTKRDELGLTQTQLARMAGTSQSSVCNAEKGTHHRVTLYTRLLDVLDHTRCPVPPRAVSSTPIKHSFNRPVLTAALTKALHKQTSVQITGGPLVGKTTLATITLAAKQQEFVLLELDGNLCFDREGDHERECAALTRLFVHQARSLLALDNKDRDPPTDLNDLAFWFKRERARTNSPRPLCLFADNLSLLQDETITRLHGLIRNFHNHRQLVQCTQVVVRSPTSVKQSSFLAESSAMFDHHVHVDWLTADEVSELVAFHIEEPAPGLPEDIFKQLCGQPQLTHALVTMLADGAELDSALPEMRAAGLCETFTARLAKLTTPDQRRALLGATSSDRESRRYLCQLGLTNHELRPIASLCDENMLLHRLVRSIDEGAS